jgi:hypothetical protein
VRLFNAIVASNPTTTTASSVKATAGRNPSFRPEAATISGDGVSPAHRIRNGFICGYFLARLQEAESLLYLLFLSELDTVMAVHYHICPSLNISVVVDISLV